MFIYVHLLKTLIDIKIVLNNFELITALVCKQMSYDKMFPFMPNWIIFSWVFFVLIKSFSQTTSSIFGIL